MEYRPLSTAKEEIRILVINPLNDVELRDVQSGTQDYAIVCELKTISLLEGTGNYIALSYRWGDPKHVTPICVSGTWVPVTTTLAYALKELRRRRIHHVWADAVCINQMDIEERAQQVMRMGAIYRCALGTMAWLGHYPKPSDLAMSARAVRVITDLAQMTEAPSVLHALTASFWASEDWMALQSVLRKNYWSRVWIIQEVAVAVQVEVFWTYYCFQFWELQKAMECCEDIKLNCSPARDLISMPEFQHINGLIRFRRSRASPIRLIHALILSRRAESSDLRDKLYALISLASDGSNTIPFPNYTVSMDALNRTTALRMIMTNYSLDGVVLPAHVTGTWVPQWHVAETWQDTRVNRYLARECVFVAERSRLSHGSSVIIKNGWKATLDEGPQWRITTQGLEVSGKSIGHVKSCSATLQEAEEDRLRPLGNIDYDWTADRETLVSLCWLLYDLVPNNEYIKAKRINAKDIHHLLKREAKKRNIEIEVPGVYKWFFCKKNLLFKIGDRRLSDWFCGTDKNWDWNPFTTDMAKRSLSILEMGMRLITTDKGLLGWATKSCQPGDELFLLRGCSVPVVLRKQEDGRYIIVGDSIIHGLMSGQGVKDQSYPQWTTLQLV